MTKKEELLKMQLTPGFKEYLMDNNPIAIIEMCFVLFVLRGNAWLSLFSFVFIDVAVFSICYILLSFFLLRLGSSHVLKKYKALFTEFNQAA